MAFLHFAASAEYPRRSLKCGLCQSNVFTIACEVREVSCDDSLQQTPHPPPWRKPENPSSGSYAAKDVEPQKMRRHLALLAGPRLRFAIHHVPFNRETQCRLNRDLVGETDASSTKGPAYPYTLQWQLFSMVCVCVCISVIYHRCMGDRRIQILKF